MTFYIWNIWNCLLQHLFLASFPPWDPIGICCVEVVEFITPEQCVRLFQSSQSRHQNDVNDVFQVSLLLKLNGFQMLLWYFHCCLSASNASWIVMSSSIYLYTFNPFFATGPFLYPLKTSENLWFVDVFRGYRKRRVPWNRSIQNGLRQDPL